MRHIAKSDMVLGATDEKRIRRRLQCKMNMRCHRDRKKRSIAQLEASITQMQSEIERASKRLALYRSLPSATDTPVSIVREYKAQLSSLAFGESQAQFMRACFSPNFTANGVGLDGFIRMWERVAPYFAIPNNILSIEQVGPQVIELRAFLSFNVSREILTDCFASFVQREDKATVDALVEAKVSIQTIFSRVFFFDQENGRWVVSATSATDDRIAQLTQHFADARTLVHR